MMLRPHAGADALRLGVSRNAICWDDSPCPLCDSTEAAAVVAEARDTMSANGPIFAVVQCRRCRLSYTNPRPDEATLPRFHESTFFRPRPSLLVRLLDVWFGGEASFPPGLFEAGRVLDCAPAAAPRLPGNATRCHREGGSIALPSSSDGRFDAIVVRRTLEHLHRPREFLQQVSKLLVPGGLLGIRCPNWDRTSTLDLPRRLTHFNPETLRMMLTTVGLRTRAIRVHRGTFALTAQDRSTANGIDFFPRRPCLTGGPAPL